MSMYETITCPHCKETWTFISRNPKVELAVEDHAWLDRHYDNCAKRPS